MKLRGQACFQSLTGNQDVFEYSYQKNKLCIKLGRGQGDGDIGTHVWGLGDARGMTWGHQLCDAGTCGIGTRDVKYRDVGDVNDYCKSRS